MVGIQIPAIQGSSGWSWAGVAANYVDVIDTAYSVFNARLIQLNIPNAWNDWVNDSQARRGLANIPNRYSQNVAWNSQYALASFSWSGALSCFSTVNQFTSSINQINAARIFFALFRSSGKDVCMTVSDADKEIVDATESANAANVITGTQESCAYIATKTWNKFIVMLDWGTIKAVPCDSDGNIIAWTIKTISYSAGYSYSVWNIVAAIWEYVWVVVSAVTHWSIFPPAGSLLTWALYSVAADGTLSLVWMRKTLIASWPMYGLWGNTVSSYTINNICYVYGWVSWQAYFGTIDLATVSDFTKTDIYVGAQWTMIYTLSFWFDGTYWLFESGWVIYRVSAAWVAAIAWVTPLWNNSFYRFCNNQTHFYTDSENFRSNHTNLSLRYKWINWLTYKSWFLNYMLCVYELTWTNNNDDATALKTIISDGGCWSDDWLSIEINWVEYGNSIVWNFGALLIDTTINITPVANLKTELAVVNTHTIAFKRWFWITWGPYLSPTGTNNMTGNSTTGSDVWAAWSFIDITLQ